MVQYNTVPPMHASLVPMVGLTGRVWVSVDTEGRLSGLGITIQGNRWN